MFEEIFNSDELGDVAHAALYYGTNAPTKYKILENKFVNDSLSEQEVREVFEEYPSGYFASKVIENDNCPKDILTKLALGDDWLSRDVCNSKNLPPETMEKIVDYYLFGAGKGVDSGSKRAKLIGISFNKSTPASLLLKMYEGGLMYRIYVVGNENFPPEKLVEILMHEGSPEREKEKAFHNPSCPNEAKLKYIQKHKARKETDEDFVQDLTEKTDDTDLNDFENLLAKNKTKIIKVAQEYDISTEEKKKWFEEDADFLVTDPKTDPKILAQILFNHSDELTRADAAGNPSTPPEVLYKAFSTEDSGYVKSDCLANPNFPSDGLEKIILGVYPIGNYRLLAARHPNINPERIDFMINGVRNGISHNNNVLMALIDNPHCPLDVKTKWMKKFNLIREEKKEDYIQDLTEKTDDTDLNDFENLLAKNKFNLKTAQTDLAGLAGKIVGKDATPEELVEALESGIGGLVPQIALGHMNCPPWMLTKELEKGNTDIRSQSAVMNLNCPPETLAMVLGRGDDTVVSEYAAENSSAPPEALAEVIGREENNQVSRNAIRNPSCPPEVLAKVVESGVANNFSTLAIKNPSCPPEILAKFLDRGRVSSDDFTEEAAQHPNSPPEALSRAVDRNDINDGYLILLRIAANPNTPPEALARIVEKPILGYVQLEAVRNPNCPVEAKIKWMRATGKIKDEKEGDFVQDLSEKKDDTDLNDFENLLAKNKFNLKTSQNGDRFNEEMDNDPNPSSIVNRETVYEILQEMENQQIPQDEEYLFNVLRQPKYREHYADMVSAVPDLSEKLIDYIFHNKIENGYQGAFTQKNCPERYKIAYISKLIQDGANDQEEYESGNHLWAIAYNKNTGLDVLRLLMEHFPNHQGLLDFVTQNPNLPLEEKIQLMRERGDIGKEKEIDYVQDLSGKQDDTELNDFENLIS